jgi:transposase
MLARLEAGQHQIDVAQAMGVSLTTLKKWLRRYRAEGPIGLLDRCRFHGKPGHDSM